MKKLLVILLSFLLLCSCSLTNQYGNMIDESKLDFNAQLSSPALDEEIAVIITTHGTIKMKFFENHAPNAVNNFKTLAKDGYYNNTFVFFTEKNVAFMAGTKDREGQEATTIFEENKPFENELTDALWHFPGAVSAMSTTKGKSDSRFFFTADTPIPDATINSMLEVGYPQSLVEKYKNLGGVPGLDKNYTIFAQVFEGFDVIEKIMSAPTDENGVPSPDIKIETIEITQYKGEEK